MAIDLHGHLTPLPYLRLLLARTSYPLARFDGDGYRVEIADGVAYRATPAHWELGARIPALDAAGVRTQALSLSAPYGFELLDGAEAVDTASVVNDSIIEGAAALRGRFIPLAVAPVTAEPAGVQVLRSALGSGHRGMMLSASVVARLPHDELLLPYLREVSAARGYVLVHPGARVETGGLPGFPYAVNVAGFQNELTVAFFRLVFGGLLDAVPNLRVVFVNLGGAAPLLAERMRSMWEQRRDVEPAPHLRFRRVFYDFSSFRTHSLEAAVAVLGADRIVVGTDYPIQELERPLQALRNARLSDDQREAIRHGNAEAILGLPKV